MIFDDNHSTILPIGSVLNYWYIYVQVLSQKIKECIKGLDTLKF